MSRWEVRWRYDRDPVWRRERVAIVVAHDEQHAQEMVWLHHVEAMRLRDRIEFVEIKEMLG